MENLLNEEVIKEYVSFDELMNLAKDIPECPDAEFPNAGALAQARSKSMRIDFELG